MRGKPQEFELVPLSSKKLHRKWDWVVVLRKRVSIFLSIFLFAFCLNAPHVFLLQLTHSLFLLIKMLFITTKANGWWIIEQKGLLGYFPHNSRVSRLVRKLPLAFERSWFWSSGCREHAVLFVHNLLTLNVNVEWRWLLLFVFLSHTRWNRFCWKHFWDFLHKGFIVQCQLFSFFVKQRPNKVTFIDKESVDSMNDDDTMWCNLVCDTHFWWPEISCWS